MQPNKHDGEFACPTSQKNINLGVGYFLEDSERPPDSLTIEEIKELMDCSSRQAAAALRHHLKKLALDTPAPPTVTNGNGNPPEAPMAVSTNGSGPHEIALASPEPKKKTKVGSAAVVGASVNGNGSHPVALRHRHLKVPKQKASPPPAATNGNGSHPVEVPGDFTEEPKQTPFQARQFLAVVGGRVDLPSEAELIRIEQDVAIRVQELLEIRRERGAQTIDGRIVIGRQNGKAVLGDVDPLAPIFAPDETPEVCLERLMYELQVLERLKGNKLTPEDRQELTEFSPFDNLPMEEQLRRRIQEIWDIVSPADEPEPESEPEAEQEVLASSV